MAALLNLGQEDEQKEKQDDEKEKQEKAQAEFEAPIEEDLVKLPGARTCSLLLSSVLFSAAPPHHFSVSTSPLYSIVLYSAIVNDSTLCVCTRAALCCRAARVGGVRGRAGRSRPAPVRSGRRAHPLRPPQHAAAAQTGRRLDYDHPYAHFSPSHSIASGIRIDCIAL